MQRFVELTAAELKTAVQKLQEFHARYADLFRTQTRSAAEPARQYLYGQLMCLERGNTTTLEKWVPDSDHQVFQQFLSDSPWQDEPIIARIQEDVSRLLGDAEKGALHVDESGFPKQGKYSVGVARQWCGCLGKVENCQVGVFLGYTRGAYRTLIDRRLYLPQAWIDDAGRRKRCGVPEEVEFQTKAELAWEMIQHAQARGVPFGYVGMDCFYGEQPWLLGQMEAAELIYIADIPCDTRVWLELPETGVPPRQGNRGRKPTRERVKEGQPEPIEVRALAAQLPAERWERQFLRDTERQELWAEMIYLRVYPVRDSLPGPETWLILRREEGTGQLRYQFSNAPPETSRERLGEMSGSRFWIERALEDGKGEVGMGDYEVRGWRGWHHHMTMTLLAMLFLLELQQEWQGAAPLLTVQDIREILEEMLPKREITPQGILEIIERKHRSRERARRSHHRRWRGEARRYRWTRAPDEGEG